MNSSKIPWFIVGLLLATLFFLSRSPLPQVQADTAAQPERTINVAGQAQINVPPDEVLITLGIQTQDKDFDIAKRQNDEALAKVLALIKTYNVPSDQVQMDFIGINPYYPYQQNQAYVVRKTIVITLKDISKFEDFITAAVSSGASSVQSIQFRTSELRKYKDQARALAIQAAKEKADALASQLGEKVSRPTHINEDQFGWYSYYDFYNWWGGQYGNSNQANTVQNVVQAPNTGNSANGDTAAAPGEISVTANVSVIFDLAN